VLIPLQAFDYDFATDGLRVRVGLVSSVPDGFSWDALGDVYYTRDLQLDAMPTAAAGPSGEICFAYVDAPERDLDVYVAVSRAPSGLGDAMPVGGGEGTTQTMPRATVDAEGRCHVIWLDNRSGDWELWSATVDAEGRFEAPEPVSDVPFAEDGTIDRWPGAANAIAVTGGRRYAVWTDTRDGQSAVYLATSPADLPEVE
jgi:hypothetical protein